MTASSEALRRKIVPAGYFGRTGIETADFQTSRPIIPDFTWYSAVIVGYS